MAEAARHAKQADYSARTSRFRDGEQFRISVAPAIPRSLQSGDLHVALVWFAWLSAGIKFGIDHSLPQALGVVNVPAEYDGFLVTVGGLEKLGDFR